MSGSPRDSTSSCGICMGLIPIDGFDAHRSACEAARDRNARIPLSAQWASKDMMLRAMAQASGEAHSGSCLWHADRMRQKHKITNHPICICDFWLRVERWVAKRLP